MRLFLHRALDFWLYRIGDRLEAQSSFCSSDPLLAAAQLRYGDVRQATENDWPHEDHYRMPNPGPAGMLTLT
jgi:hypothetical protein